MLLSWLLGEVTVSHNRSTANNISDELLCGRPGDRRSRHRHFHVLCDKFLVLRTITRSTHMLLVPCAHTPEWFICSEGTPIPAQMPLGGQGWQQQKQSGPRHQQKGKCTENDMRETWVPCVPATWLTTWPEWKEWVLNVWLISFLPSSPYISLHIRWNRRQILKMLAHRSQTTSSLNEVILEVWFLSLLAGISEWQRAVLVYSSYRRSTLHNHPASVPVPVVETCSQAVLIEAGGVGGRHIQVLKELNWGYKKKQGKGWHWSRPHEFSRLSMC